MTAPSQTGAEAPVIVVILVDTLLVVALGLVLMNAPSPASHYKDGILYSFTIKDGGNTAPNGIVYDDSVVAYCSHGILFIAENKWGGQPFPNAWVIDVNDSGWQAQELCSA